ncbi:MAG: serine/threonine-protein phosphatase, partial [Gemmataceae bacterium]|nr:serine/threonine-protein phosphatase [Gemmataceae bacterium]
AAEARLLGDRLRAGAGRADRERELARRVRRSLLPAPLVEHGRVRFTVRPGDGGAFVDVLPARAEGVGFYLGEPVGGDPVAGVMVGAVAARGAADAGWDPVGGLLWVNQAVLDLGPDEPPLVAMLAGRIDPETGRLTVARAGLPAPVVLPAKGEPEAWGGPGPFLGVAAASFEPSGRTLGPGDRLVAGTAGAVGLRAAVGRHRALAGEAFLAAVAAELPDPVALLAVEVAAE